MHIALLPPDTSPAVYRHYIERRLCWHDGAPTHASSGLQRQCPKCRAKWSYEHLALELRLFEEFVLGRRAAEAVRLVGCAKNTALGHFSTFNEAVEEIIRDRLIEGGIATNPTSVADLRSLERALRAGSRSRRRLACRHLFFRSLTLEERTPALFEETLAEQARRRADQRPVLKAPPGVAYMPSAERLAESASVQAVRPARPTAPPRLDAAWTRVLQTLSESLDAFRHAN